jgi:hypothetical protein
MATAFYGILSSIPRLYDRKIRYIDNRCDQYQYRQMLLTDKIGTAFAVGCVAPLMWPVFLFHDIKLAEILLTNKNPNHYGFDTNWDY